MPTEIVTGVIGVVTGFASGGLTARYAYKGQIESLKETRRNERDRKLDCAKTGYRALYRKFAEHYDTAIRLGGDMDLVREDFREAKAVGFVPLSNALERFWPAPERLAGHPPSKEHWHAVEEAFETLAGLTLDQWERAQDTRRPFGRLARFTRA
jgi:hypothetical protein